MQFKKIGRGLLREAIKPPRKSLLINLPQTCTVTSRMITILTMFTILVATWLNPSKQETQKKREAQKKRYNRTFLDLVSK